MRLELRRRAAIRYPFPRSVRRQTFPLPTLIPHMLIPPQMTAPNPQRILSSHLDVHRRYETQNVNVSPLSNASLPCETARY